MSGSTDQPMFYKGGPDLKSQLELNREIAKIVRSTRPFLRPAPKGDDGPATVTVTEE